MRVSKIEIFGFKSFMDRLVLNLDQGITGVVGPNGCGKSNIVDAIRWVLGETRAKNLRGGVLEDIIFNGTDELRPLGLAEVSLTVEADGKHFLEDLVSQDHEVDQMTEQANQDQSIVEGSEGEEATQHGAAGAQYAVGSLLEKYSWLKSASEVQVTRRLYRSGESEFFINRVQCRLKDMKDFFRAIGLSAKGYTIVAQGEVSKIVTSKPEQRRRFLEEAAGVQGFRERINSTESRLKETTQNLERIDDIITEVNRTVGGLKRQATKAENREELKQEILDLDLKTYKHGLSNLIQREETYNDSVSEVKEAEQLAEANYQECYQADQALRSELMAIDAEADEFRYKIDSARDKLNQIARAKIDKSNQLSNLKAEIATAGQIQVDVVDRLASLAQRISQVETVKVDLVSQREEYEKQADELGVNNDAQQEEVYNKLKESKKEQAEIEDRFRSLREKLVGLQAEEQALSRQVESNLKPEQLKSLASDLGMDQNLAVLLEGIKIDSQYAEALEAILADKASFVVTEQPAEMAKKFLDSNPDSKPSIGFIQAGSAEWNNNIVSGFQPILGLIQCEDKYKSAINSLLNNVYLAESIDQAWEFFNNNSDNFTKFVTLDGTLVTRNCIYFASKSSSILKIKNRLEELSGMISVTETELEDCKELRNQVALVVKSTQQNYDGLLQKARSVQSASRDLSSKIGAINGRMQSEERLIDQLKSDIVRLEEKSEQSKLKEVKLLEELAAFDDVSDIDDSKDQEDEINLQLTKLNEEYQAKESTRKLKRQELDQCAANLNTYRIKLDQAKQKVSGSALEKEKIALEREAVVERIEADYGSDFYDEHNFSSVRDQIMDKSDYQEAKEKLQKLKNRLIREGEIDPESIGRYQEEKARLEDLEIQKSDLHSASKSIQQTLEKLKETSEVRFQETFQLVQQNFSHLVPKLFGGGHGDLTLSDPDNPLNSGLEISAKPPGKKLKSIELMSGGEKAMCATALIVSMFMVRPSPLCILDEVDAPLDDANLARFLGVIKEMSSETQFLMITHNKQSMSISDKLVGVTMQKPGASNVLAVGLSEAFEQVA